MELPTERWRGLSEFGFPDEFPAPPLPLDELLRIRLPGDFGLAETWVRDAGLALAYADPACWGIGVGSDTAGGAAAAFIVHPGRAAEAAGRLPEWFAVKSQRFATVFHEIEQAPKLTSGQLVSPPYSGARSGCFVSTSPDGLYIVNNTVGGWSGGTLSGIFKSPGGQKLRGLTNAHVALDAGFETLMANLPNSLRDLLASPKGRQIYAWDDHEDPNAQLYSGFGPGDPYVLFTVDTDTRIFTPVPFIPGMSPLVAALMPIFVYSDVAAGDVLPQGLPGSFGTPPMPVARRTVRGALLGSAQVAIPGDRVYKTGTATGTTWGTTTISSAFIFLPLPPVIPLLPPQVVVFDLDFHTTAEVPGDSGSLAVRLRDQAPLTVCGFLTGHVTAGTPTYLAGQYSGTDI